MTSLSPRQASVMKMICSGHSLAEIGERLSISPYTVAAHLQRAKAKLGARTMAQAAVMWAGKASTVAGG